MPFIYISCFAHHFEGDCAFNDYMESLLVIITSYFALRLHPRAASMAASFSYFKYLIMSFGIFSLTSFCLDMFRCNRYLPYLFNRHVTIRNGIHLWQFCSALFFYRIPRQGNCAHGLKETCLYVRMIILRSTKM